MKSLGGLLFLLGPGSFVLHYMHMEINNPAASRGVFPSVEPSLLGCPCRKQPSKLGSTKSTSPQAAGNGPGEIQAADVVDPWAPTVGTAIRVRMIVVGVALWLLGSRQEKTAAPAA